MPNIVYQIYLLVIGLSVLLTSGMAIMATRSRHPVGRLAGLQMACAAEVTLMLFLVVITPSDALANLWARLRFLGLSFFPVCYLLFVLAHTGMPFVRRRSRIALLLVVPLITQLLVWSNGTHHLFIAEWRRVPAGPLMLESVRYGPWFRLHSTYSYLLIGLGLLLLLLHRRRAASPYREQSTSLVIWTFIALGGIALGTFFAQHALPSPGPIALALMSVLMFWSVRQHHLLNLVPLAQDTLIASMDDAVFIMDADAQIIEVNPAAERMVRHPRARLLRQHPQQFLPDWPRWVEAHDTQEARVFEMTLMQDTYEVRLSRLRDRDSRMEGHVVVARDITARKALELKLLLRERAIDKAPLGVVIADTQQPDMPLIYVNDAFCDMTGYGREEVLGRNSRFLQGTERDQPELLRLRDALHQGAPCTVMLQNFRKDGSLFWNRLHVSPVYDATHTLTHFVGIQSDVTEQHQLEAMQEEVLRLVSHDLRTPLAIIMGASTFLQERMVTSPHPADEDTQEFLDMITRASTGMMHLLQSLLDIARLEEGTQLPTESVELADCLRHEMGMWGDQARQAGITFEVEMPEEAVMLYLEPALLSQAIGNLISNAIKYSDPGSVVTLVARIEGPLLLIQVRDQGLGIPPDEIPFLFERFRRGASRAHQKRQGTGLGLALVKTIIERFGGQITVESVPGAGSTFTLLLPYHPTPTPP